MAAIDDPQPSRILKHIYLGGKHHAKSKFLLQQLNITHILNCTPSRSVDRAAGCSNYFEKDKLFIYKRISVFDNRGEDISPHLITAYDFIEHAKYHGNVLVHCHRGVSRSAAFVIAYLMRKNEMTLDEAMSHVQSCRPVVQPNASFMSQLRQFELKLKASQEELQDSPGDSAIGVAGPCIGPTNATHPQMSGGAVEGQKVVPSMNSESNSLEDATSKPDVGATDQCTVPVGPPPRPVLDSAQSEQELIKNGHPCKQNSESYNPDCTTESFSPNSKRMKLDHIESIA